jgi:hypothetical protein
MFEQKSCFAPWSFEQKSFFEPIMVKQSLSSHPKYLSKSHA